MWKTGSDQFSYLQLHQGIYCQLYQGIYCQLYQGIYCQLYQGIYCQLYQVFTVCCIQWFRSQTAKTLIRLQADLGIHCGKTSVHISCKTSLDISCESSASRWFIRNVILFSLKIKKKKKNRMCYATKFAKYSDRQ